MSRIACTSLAARPPCLSLWARLIAFVAASVVAAAAGAARVEATYAHQATLDESTGYGPAPGLAVGTDGFLYGLADKGGSTYWGTVFRVGPGGTVVDVHDFTYAEGAGKEAPLTAMPDGSLWGVASGGGEGSGTVFRYEPATGALTIVHAFRHDDQGEMPVGRLLLASDGLVYGTTLNGGPKNDSAYDAGTIFRIDPATFAFARVHAFTRTRGEIGGNPKIGLAEGDDGRLYGATGAGREYDDPGALFAFDRATGVTHLLHQFAAYGESVVGELVPGPGGALYGTTTGDPFAGDDPGMVFSVRADGRFEIVHAFADGHGVYPRSGLTLGADAWLYGNTGALTLGGPGSKRGTTYRLRPNGGGFQMLHVYDDDLYRGAYVQRGDVLLGVAQDPYPGSQVDEVFTLTLSAPR